MFVARVRGVPWNGVVVRDSVNTCVPVQVFPGDTVADVKRRMVKLGMEPRYWPDRESRRIFFEGEPLEVGTGNDEHEAS